MTAMFVIEMQDRNPLGFLLGSEQPPRGKGSLRTVWQGLSRDQFKGTTEN